MAMKFSIVTKDESTAMRIRQDSLRKPGPMVCLRGFPLALCILGLLVHSTQIRADTPMPLDRISLWVGCFYPSVDEHVSANGTHAPGSDVDFRRDLGLDERRVLSNVRLDFLVMDHQGFSIGGYRYSRSGSTTLMRDIRFAGVDYHASADVSARLRLQTFDASWHWWFSPTPRDAVGFGLGVAYYDLSGVIQADIDVNTESVSGRGHAEGNAFAPLLTIGWKHAFSARTRTFVNVAGVHKNGGRFNGHLLNARVGVEYFPWRHVGLALEYDSSDLHINADEPSWQGHARLRFQGPAAFLRVRL